MINFTDKGFLDGWGIDIEFVETELSRLFPKNKQGDLVASLRDVANKVVDDYISTGELDQYIQKYGTGFIDKLKTTAARDIGVVLISAMNDWEYATTKDWNLSLYATSTRNNYHEWVEEQQPWGTSSVSVHVPAEKYSSELKTISSIIEEGFPQHAKEDTERYPGTISLLTQFISDEIRTKEDALREEILKEAKRTLTDKTPALMLEKYFDGDKEKIGQFDNLINQFIEETMKKIKPTLFANMSHEEHVMATQDLKRHLVDEICYALRKSESSLYNETWLRSIASKKGDVDIDFSGMRKTIYQLAENIANITIIPQTQTMHDAELAHLSEEGYDVAPEDECQWEEFEYISHNARESISNIATAIRNAINEGMSDIVHYISNKTLTIGDDVLENNGSTDTKSKGLLGRFVDEKTHPNQETVDLPSDKPNDVPNRDDDDINI